MDFHVDVPAMRGKIGSRTYYACLMPLSAIPNLFKFTDWIGFTPEDRVQRILNEKRVPDLKNYILDNDEDYLFSAITASYKTPPVFEPKNGEGAESNIGILKLKLGDELIINDGQHRCAGIAAALKENPEIGDHTIAVLLFNYESKERVQQMFSDLNRFVVKTSKSLDVLYDKRDKISAATIAFLDQVPLFKALTEKDDFFVALQVHQAVHAGGALRRQPRAAQGQGERRRDRQRQPAQVLLGGGDKAHAGLELGVHRAQDGRRAACGEDRFAFNRSARSRRPRCGDDEGSGLASASRRSRFDRLVQAKQGLGECVHHRQLGRLEPSGACRDQGVHQGQAPDGAHGRRKARPGAAGGRIGQQAEEAPRGASFLRVGVCNTSSATT